MRSENSQVLKFAEIVLLVLIIVFTIHPVENYDIWFHLKYGEYIVKTHSLPFTDVFSHTAFGAPAVPYEWLFQVFIYFVFRILGNIGIQIVVVTFTLSYILIFRRILTKIFHVSIIPRIVLISGLYILGYNFWVERPQVVAYFLFMLTLYLVLERIYLHRAKLWLTPFIFLIWTNLHASMIVGLYLFFVFGGSFLLKFFRTRGGEDKALARDLLGYGAIGSVFTILPPLGTKVYRLLYLFFEKRDFITKAIDEWVPLYELSARYYIYLAIFALAGAAIIFALVKKYPRDKLFLLFPFIPLSLFVIFGVRQTPFTVPVTFLLFVPALQTIKLHSHKFVQYTAVLIVLFLSLLGMQAYRSLLEGISKDYPKNAIPFIKQNLKGNMFNEYSVGGYLMYQLGPDIKTFIDGRTDMFLSVVLPDYTYFSGLSFTDDNFYLEMFNKLVAKYHISWATLATNRFSLSWRLGRILTDDPAWHLVYFDDTAKIYVKDDGVNNDVVAKYAMKAVTPLGKTLYRKGEREEARQEYQEMCDRVKSAMCTNALGYMLLEDKKYDEARNYFIEALKINPAASAPKMNLAELAASDGNFTQAISLYRRAIEDDPERGLAYLRLGQLIIDSGGSKEEAGKIWQKALTVTTDTEIRNQLQQALKDNH